MNTVKCCNRCGEFTTNFSLRPDRNNNPHKVCDTCRSEIRRQYYLKIKSQTPFKQKYNAIKSKCKRFSIPFDLDKEYLEKIWTGYCSVSGISINMEGKRAREDTAELDRIDPDKGYIKGNVAWLSHKMNRIKNNGKLEDFKLLVKFLEKEYAQ